MAQGLSVIQGDADTDLAYYPDLAFDYAILSQTIQATLQPALVLEQLLRIGKRAIVSFPNFGHWKVRAQLMFGGQMPRTDNLPEEWYDTLNIHLCTIKDFLGLCDEIAPRWSAPWRSTPRVTSSACPCRNSHRTCSANRRCSCCRGRRASSRRYKSAALICHLQGTHWRAV
ncbi:MAG: methionine biosynthesis protein MetW [Hyphomicrobiales bacterium]